MSRSRKLVASFPHSILLPAGIILLAMGVTMVLPQMALAASWTITGNQTTIQYGGTATLLNSGKVLLAGGTSTINVPITTCELYDPTTGIWANTGPLSNPRWVHSATLLPNGKVLVAGGSDGAAAITSAELYDPTSTGWTSAGNLNAARQDHTATLLKTGKVLVAGGWIGTGSDGVLASAELYTPNSGTGTWSSAGVMSQAREVHTATLLPNGQVLVAGGWAVDMASYPDINYALTNSELYNPSTNSWSSTTSLHDGRAQHTATLLPNGKVLVAGGISYEDYYNSGDFNALSSAELYDPDTETWTYTGSLNTARANHTATLLANGKVLVAGGYNTFNMLQKTCNNLNSAELYDPATGKWTYTDQLNTARSGHTATLLKSGKVLATGGGYLQFPGGIGTWTFLNSAELYVRALRSPSSILELLLLQ
jgi:N-acetylneuraminic acid mutarotase